MRQGLLLLSVCAIAALTGCGPAFTERAVHGITFYCPGAGNVDFGDAGVRSGLERAGYKGQVASFLWTISFNPALDQTLRLNAKLRAGQLTGIIEDYIDRYPGKPVNLIGLSAGSGIAIWAVEGLGAKYKVDNVVLLSSSLWYRYDVSKALPHIKGKIYNYYSSQDAILAGPMKVFGSIDGVFGDDGAGAVGLRPPKGADRIVNIPWRAEFTRYGYYGGHTDGTSPAFVQAEIAGKIIQGAERTGKADANPPETVPLVVHRD